MTSSLGIRAGRAFVELFADDTRLVRGLRIAEARLKAWGNSVRSIGAKLFAAGGGVVVAEVVAAEFEGTPTGDRRVAEGVAGRSDSGMKIGSDQAGNPSPG